MVFVLNLPNNDDMLKNNWINMTIFMQIFYFKIINISVEKKNLRSILINNVIYTMVIAFSI